MGENAYGKLDKFFYEYPAPCLSNKSFNLTITDAEVGITPSMQRWIDNPFHELTDSEADQSDSEEEVGSSDDAGGEGEGVGPQGVSLEARSPPRGGSGIDILIQSLESELNPAQTEVHTEMPTSPVTYPLESHTPLENIHISHPTTNKAQMESSTHEADGQDPPSSAAVHPTLSRLEQEVVVTAKTTPTQLSVKSLETHITAPTLTHVGSIEDDVPLLNIPILDMGKPPPTTSFTMPTQKAFASSVLAHDIEPQTSLHNLAQVRTDLPKEQGRSQTSHSVSYDLPYSQHLGCEDTTTPPVTQVRTCWPKCPIMTSQRC